jgi:holo-[acyl-carrier protein] synthase
LGRSRADLASHLYSLVGGGAVAGVGVDLVDIHRFRRVLDRTPGVIGRMFTEDEQGYAEAKRDPAERYAARFAAKEAVMKAMRVGVFQVPLTDIEVVRDDESGAPSVQLHREAAALAESRRIVGWQLTMTHIDAVAEAVALAFETDTAGGWGSVEVGTGS